MVMVFFTIFITAWFSVCYAAITLTGNSLQIYSFPADYDGVDYNSTTVNYCVLLYAPTVL
jgi:hypothetical protein